ncbi:MAG: choice-of-anchor D domain-containing protein [Planctomycetota bacterium]
MSLALAGLLLGPVGCAKLVASEPQINYGEVLIGNSVERSVRWSNQGDGEVRIEALTVEGDRVFATQDRIVEDLRLDARETSPDITVAFKPVAAESYQAVLNPDASTGGDRSKVRLMGWGVYVLTSDSVDLHAPGGSTTAPLNFGEIPLQGAGGIRNLEVTNTSVRDLTVKLQWRDGRQGFSLDQGVDALTLGSGENQTVRLVFNPERPGVFSDALLISVADRDQQRAGLVVEGQGMRSDSSQVEAKTGVVSETADNAAEEIDGVKPDTARLGR